ncbi:MAG: hypothetical protein ACLR23_02525 [Clostridia bacterium]
MKNENAYNSAMLVKRRKASEVSSEQNAYLRSLKQHTRKIMAGRFLLLATFLLLGKSPRVGSGSMPLSSLVHRI